MNMNKEQVGLAIQSGLELLGPESEVSIPAKLNDGVFLLKQLLQAVATGQIALAPATQEKPPGADTPPNRKDRRAAAKKVAKKKISRKKS